MTNIAVCDWSLKFFLLTLLSACSNPDNADNLEGIWFSQSFYQVLQESKSFSTAKYKNDVFFFELLFTGDSLIGVSEGSGSKELEFDKELLIFTHYPYPYYYPDSIATYKIIKANKKKLIIRRDDGTEYGYFKSAFENCSYSCLSLLSREWIAGNYELEIGDVFSSFQVSASGSIAGLRDYTFFSWRDEYHMDYGNYDVISLRGPLKDLNFMVDRTDGDKIYLTQLDVSSRTSVTAVLVKK